MKIQRSKKGDTNVLVNYIVLAVVIILTAAMFIRVYLISHDSGNRELCNLQGVKNEVTNVKDVGFWKSYEINCKAEENYLKLSDINAVQMSQSLSDIAKSIYGKPPNSDQIKQIKLQNYFATKLKNCWQITGNNSIFQWKEFPNANKVSQEIADTRTNIFYNRQLAQKDSLPPTCESSKCEFPMYMACMICSTVYFDSDTKSTMGGNLDLMALLQQTSFSQTKSLWNELATFNGVGPTQSLSTQTPQSVIYYQWEHYTPKGLETPWGTTIGPNMADGNDHTGVLIIPTQDIASLCDVVVNQQ